MRRTTIQRNTISRLAALGAAFVLAGGLYGQHTAQQTPPIKLGTSGGSVKDITSAYCCSGTLGSQVVDAAGVTYILSNNHVLADVNAGTAGDAIMQRGYVDTVPPCTTTGTIVVANLTKFVPISFTANNVVDAAIAATVGGQVSPTGFILGIGAPSRAIAKAAVNMAVKKSGRSGVSSGTVSALDVSVTVGGYGVCGCGQSGQPACKTAKFIGQITITPGTFIQPGDSGSLVVKPGATGARSNPVGLIFAGSSSLAIANPIAAVEKAFTVALGAIAPTAEESQNAAAATDPEADAAARVKDQYDDFLFTLPGVVGHGVGKDSSGHAVIQLFVTKATDAIRQAAPSSLGGFPVVVLETGEFRVVPHCGSCPACKK